MHDLTFPLSIEPWWIEKDTNEIKERFGKGLVDTLRKSFDELQASITEVEVEKWTRLVDSERMYATI